VSILLRSLYRAMLPIYSKDMACLVIRHTEDQIAHDIDPGPVPRPICSCLRVPGERRLCHVAKDPPELLLIHLWPSAHQREQSPFIAIGPRQDRYIGR